LWRRSFHIWSTNVSNTWRIRSREFGFFAERNAKTVTEAERLFEIFLIRLNGGVLKNRYKRQHVVSGKWIVDFFRPQIRLAIEIDGPSHEAEAQRLRDRQKDADCANLDITVLRIANSQVFDDPDDLVPLLREGWKLARRRKNRLIGQPYQMLAKQLDVV
jgi:very-short-patch-repair endonuclease